MKKFFYYANLILCIGTFVSWIIAPMFGAFVHLVLGGFQIVNAVIYLVQLRTFGMVAKRMFRIYGLFVLFLIALGILMTVNITLDPQMKRTLAILLMTASGASAIFFTYVTYVVKNEETSVFEESDDEILDSDMLI